MISAIKDSPSGTEAPSIEQIEVRSILVLYPVFNCKNPSLEVCSIMLQFWKKIEVVKFPTNCWKVVNVMTYATSEY